MKDNITMDNGVIDRIFYLQKNGHPNAVPVFCGAAFAYNVINCEYPDVDEFINYLNNARRASYRYGYTDINEVTKIFCELCLVDPMLFGIR